MQTASPRKWLVMATIGCAMVVAAMAVALLALVDKKHFEPIVGRTFVQVITSGVIVGSIVLVAGASMLPERKTWPGIVLIVWGLIALTSPLFGFMFLLPWAALAVSLPIVILALVTLFRRKAVV